MEIGLRDTDNRNTNDVKISHLPKCLGEKYNIYSKNHREQEGFLKSHFDVNCSMKCMKNQEAVNTNRK